MTVVPTILQFSIIDLIVLTFDLKMSNHLPLLEFPLEYLLGVSLYLHAVSMFLEMIEFAVVDIGVIIIDDAFMDIVSLRDVSEVDAICIFLYFRIWYAVIY